MVKKEILITTTENVPNKKVVEILGLLEGALLDQEILEEILVQV